MDQKPKKEFISEDRKKLNSFFSFQMDQNKFQQIQKNSNKQIARFIVTGLVFGFITEWMLGNSTIYDNIIKKTTMRRLTAKKKEDMRIEERLRHRAERHKQ